MQGMLTIRRMGKLIHVSIVRRCPCRRKLIRMTIIASASAMAGIGIGELLHDLHGAHHLAGIGSDVLLSLIFDPWVNGEI